MLFGGNDKTISDAEFAVLSTGLSPPQSTAFALLPSYATDHEKLLALMDTVDATSGEMDGVIDIDEAAAGLLRAGLVGDLDGGLDKATEEDKDGDGKIDPLGYEVNTGGVPVYLSMDSALVRAQGFLNLDVFGIVTLSGSFAFELGPTADVEVVDTDGNVRHDTVTTMTIGAANVFGFIGWDGPYFVDGGIENNDLDRVTPFGEPIPGEINADAKGLALNDLNVGIFIGLSIEEIDNPAAYFAMDFSVETLTVVGLEFLSATATLGTRLNVGASLDPGEVIDFKASFENSEADDGVDYNGDGDMNDTIDGFLVNTGDAEDPILLDFDGFLVNIELAGDLTISAGGSPIVEMLGTFFLEIDGSGFKLFATAALVVGPDIGSSKADRLLDISALGVVIINSDGFAADFDVDLALNIPGIEVTVSARVIINTTNEAQRLTIPTRIIDFLNASTSPLKDSVLDRLKTASNGDRFYMISKFAPDMLDVTTLSSLLSGTGAVKYTTSTDYVVAVVRGTFDFLGFASAEGTAGISVSSSRFQLYVDLQFRIGVSGLELKFKAKGIMEISKDGLYLNVAVSLEAELSSLLSVDVRGTLLIDTTGGSDPTRRGNTRFTLTLDGDLTIARIITVDGHLLIDVGAGGANTWRIEVGLSGTLGPINITGSAWVQSDGQFSVTLSGGLYFGVSGFSISGGVSGTVSLTKSGANYVYNPGDTYTLSVRITGSVTLTIIGIDIGASVTLGGTAVFSANGTVIRLYARGCVSFGWFGEACGGGTIASIAIPGSIFPELPPELAEVTGRVLTLNTGERRNRRNVATSTTAETYQLTDLGGGKVRVEAFGYTEIYEGVDSVAGHLGSDDDVLTLTNGFALPVDIEGGDGKDRLSTAGYGPVVFDGGNQDDILIGGPAADIIRGGRGNDYLDGSGGRDTIDGGDGNDVLFGVIGDLAGDNATGGTGTDTLEVRGTSSPDVFSLTLANGNLRIARAGLAAFNVNGFENVLVVPEEGSDTVNLVGNLSPSGIRTFSVSLGENTQAVDSVNITLADTADTLILSGANGAAIPTNQRSASGEGAGGVTPSAGQVANTTANWLQGQNTVISASDSTDRIQINTLGGADNILIPSIVAKAGIDGGVGRDRIAVGSRATTSTNSNGILEAIDNDLVLAGGIEDDFLSVDDTGDTSANTGTLTATTLSGLGMTGSISYYTFETLEIGLGSSADTFTIESTHANTTRLSGNGGDDTVNVNGTGAGGETILNGDEGNNIFNIRGISGNTSVNGGNSSNTINVGSNSLGTPGARGSNSGGNVNRIAGLLTVNGNGPASGPGDVLNVDDTGDGSVNSGALTSTRLTGLGMAGSISYGTIEELNISQGGGGDTFTINGTHGAATGAYAETTTLNTGGGDDTVTINDVTDRLFVNGQASRDVIHVNGTGVGSDSTLNGGDGEDIFNIRAINGNTTVNGNNDSDTVNVGSNSMGNPGAPNSNSGGNVNRIAGLLTVNGDDPGSGSGDVLNVDDTGDGSVNTGALTSTRLTGLGMAGSISYGTIEELNISQGGGGDTFTINGTHGAATGAYAETTTLNTGGGDDTVTINDVTDRLFVNGQASRDVIHVNGTGVGSDSTLNGGDGEDIFNIRAINGNTTVNGNNDSDTVNVGSKAAGSRVSLAAANNNSKGDVNAIAALLTVNGNTSGGGVGDVLNVDETGESVSNTGNLTGTRIWGLGMPGSGPATNGITYGSLEALNVNLGAGGNNFFIQGSHSTVTTVNAGLGPVNKVYVGSNSGTPRPVANSTLHQIGGQLTINGQSADSDLFIDNSGETAAKIGKLTATEFTHESMMTDARITFSSFDKLEVWLGIGNDRLFVDGTPADAVTMIHGGNEVAVDNQTNDVINISSIGGYTKVHGGTGNDVIRVNYNEGGLQTNDNGISAALDLHGGGGSDLYEIGLAGYGSSLIRVSDPDPGDIKPDPSPNRLKVYGTPRRDDFLFRPGVIAAIGLDDQGDQTGLAERINYDSSVSDITIYGGDEVDTFILDDTNSPLTIYGEGGDDVFQVGQIFAGPRHPGDIPTGSDLNDFDALLGLDPLDQFRTTLTTRGFLSNGNGVGKPTTIYGGIGNDNFTVYSNKADLFLYGEEDDDTFTVRAFVKVDPDDSKAPFTNINGGQGADFISYTVNAPVNIEGGDGFDTLTVIGTEFGDDFVITERGILGAGLFVRYGGLEKVVVDALEGNDTFFIQSTSESLAIEIVGGLGSDTFHVGGGNNGEAITVVANDLLGHSGLVVNETSSSDERYQTIFAQDISVNVADSDEAGIVVSMVEGPIRVFEAPEMAGSNLVQDRYSIVLTRSPEDSVQVTAVPTLSKRSEHQAGGQGLMLNGKLDGVSLLFDRSNWFIPQYILVTAPNDELAEGARQVLIQHSVQQGGSADDGGAYDNISVPTVVADVIDNDTAGVLVAAVAVAGARAVVTEEGESGASYDYYVVLTRAPTANVVVDIEHDAQIETLVDELTFTPGVLITPGVWFAPQVVTVTAAADLAPGDPGYLAGIENEGFHFSRITHALAGTVDIDSFYALTPTDVSIGLHAEIKGDDAAQFVAERNETTGVITITRAGGGTIDARNLTGAGTDLGFTGSVTAADAKDVVLSGVPVANDVWTIELNDDTFTHTVSEGGQSLADVARFLRDSINANQEYVASILGDTLLLRKLNGAPLAATATVAGVADINGMAVEEVTVYTSVAITVSGTVSDGDEWGVMLNGQEFRYVAGSNGESVHAGSVDVRIADKDVAGVLVRETLGITSVIEPSDLILLGGGQVTDSEDDGASVSIVVADDSPAIVVDISISGSGLVKSEARATISGSAVWLDALVDLDDVVTAYPKWVLTLTRGGVESFYSVGSAGKTKSMILADFVQFINDDTTAQYQAEIDDLDDLTLNDTLGFLRITDSSTVQLGFTAQMVQGRASISGVAAWRELNIALTGNIAITDTIKVSLSGAGVANFVAVAGEENAAGGVTTLVDAAQQLEDELDDLIGNAAGQINLFSVEKVALTQFAGDFGTAVMNETSVSHDNAFNAQPIDFGMWGRTANPDITGDTTVPHLTIKGSGDGGVDFYKFEISQEMINLGQPATFDIDHGYEGFGPYWGSQLRLYKLAPDADGALTAQLVAESPEVAAALDAGSSSFVDGLLTHTFINENDPRGVNDPFGGPGTYVLEVLNWLGPKVSANRTTGLPKGVLYDLNISLPGHDVAKFTFAPAPVIENESQQDSSQQYYNSTNSSAAQNVDSSQFWFTFDDGDIGNSEAGDGSITSAIPYVTILGSGNGSYDEYRFEIAPEMLSRAAGDTVGSVEESGRIYYTMVGTTLLGTVETNDEWTVAINGPEPSGREFSYIARPGTVLTLATVAAGIQADFDAYIAGITDSNRLPTYTLVAAGDSLTIEDENGFWIELTHKVASAGEVSRQLSTVSTVSFDTVELTLDGTPIEGENWKVLIDGADSQYSVNVASGQDLDAVGQALAALDGNEFAGPATYEMGSNILKITGLGGVRVGFSVSGTRPSGTASIAGDPVIAGTPVQNVTTNNGEVTTDVAGSLVTEAKVVFSGTPAHNQTWTLTLTDESNNVVTKSVEVGQVGGETDEIDEVLARFSNSNGYRFTPGTFGSEDFLTITKNGGGIFSVAVSISPTAPHSDPDPIDGATSTASYYSEAVVDLSGTPHLGETWSLRIKLADGTERNFSYVVGDSDHNGSIDSDGDLVGADGLNRADVAEGLKLEIERHVAFVGIASRDGSDLELTKTEGIKVDNLSVTEAPVAGSIDVLSSASIDLTGLTVGDGQAWILTLDGDVYTYTTPASGTADEVDTVGNAFATAGGAGTTPNIPARYAVSYDDGTDVLTIIGQAGLSVSLNNGAPAATSDMPGSLHAVTSIDFDLTALPVVIGDTWTLTLNGTDYSYVIPNTGTAAAPVTPSLEAVGDIYHMASGRDTTPKIPANEFDVTFNAATKVLSVSRDDSAPFTASFLAGSNEPVATPTYDSTWSTLSLALGSDATPVRPGEVWTLNLGGTPHSVTVGPQPSGGPVTTLEEIGAFFAAAMFNAPGNRPENLTVISPAGDPVTLQISRGDTSPFTAMFSVAAPATGTLALDTASSTASHWSTAKIDFVAPGEVNIGETWTLVLKRPGETTGTVLVIEIEDYESDGTINLVDFAKGFELLIGDPLIATASGSVLTYMDDDGVAATVAVTPLPVATTATISGKFASQWQQTILFTGGAGGASSTGDLWVVEVDGNMVDLQADGVSGPDLAPVAADFYSDLNTGDYRADNPGAGNSLTFWRTDGDLAAITLIEQTRDLTESLVDDHNVEDTQLTHYSRFQVKLDSTREVRDRDVWAVTLNGHEFSVIADANDNVAGIAAKLRAEINNYSDVYRALIETQANRWTIRVDPGVNAWFTGMTADANEGGGSVKAIFDIDNGNTVRGSQGVGYWWYFERYSYTDSLNLEVYEVSTDGSGTATLIPMTRSDGVGTLDKGSNSLFDPFLEHEFDTAGTYIVRVGTHRTFDANIFAPADHDRGVSTGIFYELNISLQRHAINSDAIELVGKQITIVEGAGAGQSGTIVGYDAKNKVYTIDQQWMTPVDETSKFEIEYYLADEFSGYQPVGDSYSVVLTSPLEGTDTVVIDVLPQITRAYNSDLSFEAESNYGESANEQIDVATPRVVVEFAGTPAEGQTWTLNLNGKNYSYLVEDGDNLTSVAYGLFIAIDGEILVEAEVLADSEKFVAVANGKTLTITSSLYEAQILGSAVNASPFTAEFSISDGRAEISDPDAGIEWENADVELKGTVRVGDSWTLQLDGDDYTYVVRDGDTLDSIASALTALLPSATYLSTTTGAMFDVKRDNDAAFEIAFNFLPAIDRHLQPDASGEISSPNAIGGWVSASINLKGTVQEGSSWTLRLDGINYTHKVNGETTLEQVALELLALLPGTFNSTVDPVNGAKFYVAKPNTTSNQIDLDRFRVAFTVLSATNLRPQLVFTAETWDTPQDVIVWAADDDIVDGGDAKVVAAVEGRVNSIRGPLTINGGFLEGVDRSLNNPYLLPGESNNPVRDGIIETADVDSDGNAFITDGITMGRPSGIVGAVHVNPAEGIKSGFDPRMNGNFYGFTILDGPAAGTFLRVLEVSENLKRVTFVGGWPDGVPERGNSYYYAPINPNVLVDEADQVDSLIVDNTDSPALDTGVLTETRLSGLGMGPDTRIGTRTLQGGITYLNLESLDIGLGFGRDTFTIESTHAGTTTVRTGDTLLTGEVDDVINIETLLGHTFIDTGSGDDRINVGTARHLLDENGGLLTIVGNSGTDELVVDDSSDATDNTGTLTQTTLTGLDMPGVAEVQIVKVLAASGNSQLSYTDSGGVVKSVAFHLGYDDPAERLQAALNASFGSTGIRVEEYRDSFKTVTYTITFGGDLAGRNMEELAWGETLESTGLIAATDSSVNVDVFTKRDGTMTPESNNLQTFTLDATGGTFTLEFQLDEDTVDAIRRGSAGVKPAYTPTILSKTSVATGALAFDISGFELAKYLDPILNPNNSNGGLPHTINFGGLMPEAPLNLVIRCDRSSRSEMSL